jgi:hypothetical protein
MCDNDRLWQLLCAERDSKAGLTPGKKERERTMLLGHPYWRDIIDMNRFKSCCH